MHQFFVKQPLNTGEDYIFTKEQEHHVRDVLHMDHEYIRLVYNQQAYFAETYYDAHILKAHILKQDPSDNDLPADISLAMCLIRREKFEFVLQKAAELGVKKVIPVISEHTIVHVKKEKQDRLMERWQAILQEAGAQCKRNSIPSLSPIIHLEELKDHMAEQNFVPYEKAGEVSPFLSTVYNPESSVTAVIGPEGGFSAQEIDTLCSYGFEPITLGHRILRAETAALYTCSVLAECSERGRK